MSSILSIIIITSLFLTLGTAIVAVLRVICAMGWGYFLNKIKDHNFFDVIKSFLQARAERKVFLTYVGAMITIFGGLPIAAAVLSATFVNEKCGIFALTLNLVSDNSMGVSLIIGLLLTIAYIAYVLFRRNSNISREVAESMTYISQQLSFYPSKEWFACQANNAIDGLHSRYDKVHNVKHEQLELILSSLRRDVALSDLWIEDMEKILDNLMQLPWQKDEKMLLIIQPIIDDIIALMNIQQWTSNDVSVFVEAYDKLIEAVQSWYYHLEYRDRQNNQYNWSQFTSYTKRLSSSIHSPWIECLHKQVMLITGAGGMGKSHLLGNIVDCRVEQGEPTIFILGAWLSDGHDPWTQILERLDVKCKKETFLNNLNDYAARTGKRIQIIIDAINESTASRGREYWAENMDDFLSTLTPYSNIGIVLSLRTTPFNGALDGFISDKSHASYVVTGFTDNLSVACEYMFDSYGLSLPYWSTMVGVFTNPMWLHMYCDAHAMMPQTVLPESHWQIVEHYIKGFNKKFAEKFEYIESRQLLRNVLFAIAYKMVSEQKIYSLSYDEVLETVAHVIGAELSATEFIKELFYADILHREIGFQGEVNVHFGFESFGNYIVTYILVRDFPQSTWVNFVLFTAEFAEIVPLLKGTEYYSYVSPGTHHYDEALAAFISTLEFRDSITDSGTKFLKNVWEQRDYDKIFEIVSYSASNPFIPYNSSTLHELLYGMSSMDRDAIWTTAISQSGDVGDRFLSLSKWIMSSSSRTICALSRDVAGVLCETFVWCLCSTNGVLRDTATKALTALLSQHHDILIEMLSRYHAVNDWYMLERIWGVAFGGCTRSHSVQLTQEVARFAYEFVFSVNPVVEHILVRDYARLIVEYAKYLGVDVSYMGQSYLPPYNTYSSIPSIPDDYIVDTYESVYKNHIDKAVSSSAMAVINSLIPEYSRRGIGGYGDFGRYTFQASLREFPEKPSELSNWATKMVFDDLGYLPDKVKLFDTHLMTSMSKRWERIGKKYQWISLYRIAAILSDYHVNDEREDGWFDSCLLATRNIDPTLLPINLHHTPQPPLFKLPEYSNPKMDDNVWIQNPKVLPRIDELIIRKSVDNVEWVCLYRYNEYTLRGKRLSMDNPNRNIWLFFQSCFISRSNAKQACQIINKHGLQGRCFDENHEIYNVYAGEWFWSSVYKEQMDGYKCEYRPFSIGHKTVINFMMRPTMLEYAHEYVNDHSSDEGDTIYFPNPNIVSQMQLSMDDMRGIWNDKNGQLALYDHAMAAGDHALFVRKDLLLDYIKETEQVVIWPILIEKRLKNWQTDHNYQGIRIKQCGGYAIMDATGRIKYKIRQYEAEPSQCQILFRKYVIKPYKFTLNRLRAIGIKRGIVRLSEKELFDIRVQQFISESPDELLRMLKSVEAEIKSNEED